MARTAVVTALTACVLAATSLLVTPAAPAASTQVGGGADVRICRTSTAGGAAWLFRARIEKRDGVVDARGGVAVHRGTHRRDRWRSGWLADGEVRRSTLRVRKGPRVRVVVHEESGDRASPIGTARQRTVLTPRRIRHC